MPQITNREAMRAKGAAELNYTWSVSDIATIQDAAPGKLVLKRAQNSGTMTVTATDRQRRQADRADRSTISGHGTGERRLGRAHARRRTRSPRTGQFYARDDKNEGTLHCNGTLADKADAVFLKVFADDKPFTDTIEKPGRRQRVRVRGEAQARAGQVPRRVRSPRPATAETVLHKASATWSAATPT